MRFTGRVHDIRSAGAPESVLRDGALSRLYLTLTHQLIGGEMFHTLYYDPSTPKGTGQWFASFELRRGA